MRRNFILVIFLVAVFVPALAAKLLGSQPSVFEREITLATTTSTQDSGLLDNIIPVFERQYGNEIKVKVIAVGSGQALKLGEDGNADVVMVHSRKNEEDFIKKGYGTKAYDLMYNRFLIVGPENDPAEVAEARSAQEAFAKIRDSKESFISRGDDSGTDKKEKAIWTAAQVTPSGEWYVSAGQGMGKTLMMAEEMRGYTLVDEATFLTTKTRLKVLFHKDKLLINQYGIIQVKNSKKPKAANELIYFLTSSKGQKLIGQFGKEAYGKSIFIPNAKIR